MANRTNGRTAKQRPRVKSARALAARGMAHEAARGPQPERPTPNGGDPGRRLTPDEIAAVCARLGVRYVPPKSAD